MKKGKVKEKELYKRMKEIGKRNKVKRGMKGRDKEKKRWRRWLRKIDIEEKKGEKVMRGEDNKKIMVIKSVGKGRVGMLM